MVGRLSLAALWCCERRGVGDACVRWTAWLMGGPWSAEVMNTKDILWNGVEEDKRKRV